MKMSKISKEISCIVGTYSNGQGEKKNRYQRVGSIIQTQRGEMVKIDVIPLKEGGWDGWCFIQEPRPKEYQGLPRDNDDDVPF
jgi:hypothetical protein